MSRFVKAVLITVATVFPGAATAHPGHGLETGLLHWVTDPFHLGVGLIIAAVVFVALRLRASRGERARARKP